MIGACVQLPERPADVDPGAVGQDEVDDRRVRRPQRRVVERLLGGLREIHLVAAVAQQHLQRAEDLRLVVAHQDARPVGHVVTPPHPAAGT